MPIVDSSVALKWVIDEPGKDIAVHLLTTSPVAAPDFLLLEVRAALWNRVRRGLSTIETARFAENEFGRASILLLATGELVRPAFELALELNHPIYDCVYLAAATSLDQILVTADNRFIAATRNSSHADRVVRLADF